MSYIAPALRQLVTTRANHRCEYCGLSQVGQEATFHVDHVMPVIAGGQTETDNLALACVSCSLRKAARQSATDPETRQEVSLYNPRQNHWYEHFQWRSVLLEGLTPIGRATVHALDMNRLLMLAIREEEVLLGRHRSP